MVKDNVIVRELDLVRVKGKNRPVRIFELLDVTG
jgi:adenylate cyclase